MAESLLRIQENRLLSSPCLFFGPTLSLSLSLSLSLYIYIYISVRRQLNEFFKNPNLKTFMNMCRDIQFVLYMSKNIGQFT